MTEALRVGPFPLVGQAGGPCTATDTASRLDDWRDLLRSHFVALDVVDPDFDGPFDSRVRSTLLGTVSVAEVSAPPQSAVRTRRLSRDGDAYLQIGLLTSGRAVVEQDGREAELVPGRFVLYETDRPFAWHLQDRWKLLVLTWPRHLVDISPDRSRSVTARPLGTDRLGALVGRMLAETAQCPPQHVDGRRLAAELAAFVTTMLGASDDDWPHTRAAADLRRKVARYIAEHIEDPALDVESIARAHYISVRGLHRCFAGAELTVGALIRKLRLAHARRRLADPRDRHLSVTDIAVACGFGDLPTFSHAFKQEYGETPTSYRRRSGGDPALTVYGALLPASPPPSPHPPRRARPGSGAARRPTSTGTIPAAAAVLPGAPRRTRAGAPHRPRSA